MRRTRKPKQNPLGILERKPSRLSFQRILVPTDFSDASREALPIACALAKRFKATITLLYVFPTCLPGELSHIGIILQQKRLEQEAGKRLARFRERELPADLSVKTLVLA